MIKIIKADGAEKEFLAEVEKRAGEVNADVEKIFKDILADVKANGDTSVKSYTAKFDCPNAQY
ncbi:MAG: histidinol dehydrogenase, partial [Oscillospiraceae bacterium]|nr:histidinol dehydrogenase [Oscillospiraceae bacterium]